MNPESSSSLSSGGRCWVVGEVAQAHDGSLGMAHASTDAIAKRQYGFEPGVFEIRHPSPRKHPQLGTMPLLTAPRLCLPRKMANRA